MNSIYQKLFSSISGVQLAVFRFLFGLVIFWEAGRLIFWNDAAYSKYINTVFHFKYPFFEWVKQAPDSIMYVIIAAVACLAILFSVGLFHKIVSPLLFLGYTYLELIDISYWNNHYYFYALILFLFIFIRPTFVISYHKDKVKIRNAKWWELNILKFLVVLVLFYGGIAKLVNPDWMNGSATTALISLELSKKDIFLSESSISFYSLITKWFGIGIDLVSGFLLLHRKTIVFGLVFLIPFNLLNSYLFNIGSFPYAMLSTLFLFIPNNWYRLISKTKKFEIVENHSNEKKIGIITLLTLFIVIQISLPLRHFFIEGNSFWTGEGKLYAWHMMSGVTHAETNKFVVIAKAPFKNNLEKHTLDLGLYLNEKQIKALSKFPYLAFQFAQFVKSEMQYEGYSDIKVYANMNMGRNGSEMKPVISPFTNLLDVKISYTSHNKWILLYLDEGY